MTRREEFDALRLRAECPPAALSGSVRRAVRRGRRRRLLRPLGAAAGAAACFAALVNVSLPFALAAHGVPGVRELAAALAVSPSLREALAHDYVQYLGYTARDGGVAVTLEYLFADPGSMTLFYRLRGVEEYEERQALDVQFQLTENGREIPAGFSWSWPEEQREQLRKMEVYFENGIPSEMELTLSLRADENRMTAPPVSPDAPAEDHVPEPDDVAFWRDDRAPQYRTVAEAVFPLRIDERLAQAERTVELGETVELLGQKIIIDRVKIFPSQTEIYWHEDADNTAWLPSVEFSLVNDAGEAADNRSNSLIAKGGAGSASRCAILQSVYFREAGVHLSVDGASLLEKGRENAWYDPETGFTDLPEGVTGTAALEDGCLLLCLRTEHPVKDSGGVRGILGSAIAGGGEYTAQARGGHFNERLVEEYALVEDYTGGRVAIPLRGGAVQPLPEPVRLPLVLR